MLNNKNQKNSLIISKKSQSPEIKLNENEILVGQPEQLTNDINHSKNEIKEERNDIQNMSNKIDNQDQNNIEGNIILIDNKNEEEYPNFNLEEKKIIIKENKEKGKINEINNNNVDKSLSDRKVKFKYFDEVNNSSIVRKEESNIEFNTNKKSQGSDYALFKIMNEIGNKNSFKVKTIESLDKLNPLNSINSQITGYLNKHEENKNDDFLKSISEPEVEEEEKSNEENINNNDKISKKLFENNNNKELSIEDNKNDKNTVVSKDIITTSNNDLNEGCIKTNEYIKEKMDSSDFLKEQYKNSKSNINNDNNSMNKINIEFFFKPNLSKNKDIEETKKDIINDINKLYLNNNLNLVKLNNHEIYNFITDYNDISKDDLDYDPVYYSLNKNDNDFISRRNNYLSHKYFSYIIKKNSKDNNNLDKKIEKYKINYNDKIPKLTINDSNKKSSIYNHSIEKKNKIIKIYDIENMSSFFYNLGLYSPDNKNKKIIDENSENEIMQSFTTYRKIYNDGKSFQRCFIYLLFENFLLKNQINKINYIIYDIKKTLNKKYLDIDNYINILIEIKESYSIDNLMSSFNNQNINIDEIMISYIEDVINNINNVDSINKSKYEEIDMNYLNILANIFEVNLEIYYIEENNNKKNNYLLSMNKINIFCNSYKKNNNNVRLSSSDEDQIMPTFYLLYFLNSFHIVYTQSSDIDSTLANNDISKKHYYLPSLPKYHCPKCNKNSPLDIIPYYEAVLCHKCLINYMNDILKNRIKSFIKSNFSSIEYFTRPITIKQDIKITFTLYRYITGNYLIQDFEKYLNNICFICYKFYNSKSNVKIVKLKCQCQLCQKCLETTIKDNFGGYKYLNLYEMHTKKFSKCPCDNIYDINELLKFAKYKPCEKDKKDALERLIIVLEDKCCICLKEKDKTEYIKLEVNNSKPHFICIDCYEKTIIGPVNNKNMNNKYGKYLNKDKNQYHDLESSNSSLRDNEREKKFFCNICNTEHIIIPEVENSKQKEKSKLKNTISKCCKKCFIF